MATNNVVNSPLSGTTGSGSFVGSNAPVITSPQIINALLDVNGNIILNLNPLLPASDNFFQISNGPSPEIAVSSFVNADADLGYRARGTGRHSFLSESPTNPVSWFTGTGLLHVTNWLVSNTAATRDITIPDATGTLLMTGQAINTVPSIAFSSTTGVIGTTTNTTPAAGSVGEYKISSIPSGSAVSISPSGTSVNVTSLTLDPGDWQVGGNVNINISSQATSLTCGISQTSATLPASELRTLLGYSVGGGTLLNLSGAPVPTQRITVPAATTLTVYLVANVVFSSGTISAFGRLYATRAS